MGMVISRFDIWLVNLDPTEGSEIKKKRPCLIISPDEMNRHINTVIIAPMTTKGNPYPTRVHINFQGKQGKIVLDQIRTIDKSRLVSRLGTIKENQREKVISVLQEIFAR
jgi:mRNA interferase MazF